jgi:hypothetical protein
MGREERFRTVISGMEPRRIAKVMLLPHFDDGSTYCIAAWLSIRQTARTKRMRVVPWWDPRIASSREAHNVRCDSIAETVTSMANILKTWLYQS